jgi:arylsulfatase A-like enzyme
VFGWQRDVVWRAMNLLSRLATFLLAAALPAIAASKPNVIFILGDDVGYGDVSCYGAHRVQTPNVDRLAAQGLRFTDGHCAAATCTPTRYALMTGEYAFRKKGTNILPGDAALIIDPVRFTLPKVFQTAGYKTGAVGKWHLGLGSGKSAITWNAEIKPGPREVGFDFSFIVPATGDRTPCVYVENQHVVNLDSKDPLSVGYDVPVGTEPTGREHPELLKMHPSHGHDQTIVNGISRIGTMTGGKSARWVDENMADTLAKQAVAFIEQNKASPFFLYFATHDIHVPRVPHPRFAGKTGMGPRGDAILQFDFQVGEVLNALDRLGLADNTLVVLSSDNGPVIDDGYKDQAVELLGDHKPAGPLRGGKSTNFEGGTRVPFIVRWPAQVQPGISDALVSQVDFIASFAALVEVAVPADASPDGINVLPALTGKSKVGRDHLVEQAGTQSLRVGHWKYIPPGKGVKRSPETNSEIGSDPMGMLFDLSKDLGETTNVIADHPEQAAQMQARLKSLQALK